MTCACAQLDSPSIHSYMKSGMGDSKDKKKATAFLMKEPSHHHEKKREVLMEMCILVEDPLTRKHEETGLSKCGLMSSMIFGQGSTYMKFTRKYEKSEKNVVL